MNVLLLNEHGIFVETSTESVAYLSYMWHKDNIYYLIGLHVSPKHRNSGLARKLLTAVCRIMDKEGSDIWLDLVPKPDTDYTRLEKLYESFGFVKQPGRYFRNRRL
jgi:ribosomal protein S18 acetylase RimI-like enzyme